MKKRPTTRFHLEQLEDRNCPAPLTFAWDYAGNLRISGNLTDTLNIVATAANTFDISEGVTPILTGAIVPGNLTITTGTAADAIFIDLSAGSLSGGLTGAL